MDILRMPFKGIDICNVLIIYFYIMLKIIKKDNAICKST